MQLFNGRGQESFRLGSSMNWTGRRFFRRGCCLDLLSLVGSSETAAAPDAKREAAPTALCFSLFFSRRLESNGFQTPKQVKPATARGSGVMPPL